MVASPDLFLGGLVGAGAHNLSSQGTEHRTDGKGQIRVLRMGQTTKRL